MSDNNNHSRHKEGVYGNNSSTVGTEFRKKWDRTEYELKAKKRDEEERERMKEVENDLQKGKKPRRKPVQDLPKPTELMKQRETPLELSKNQNKTIIVQGSLRGPGAPGFYCDLCSRTSKDSSSYLDHLNSRFHLRQLGQKTQVARSTLDQVRARIASLREATSQQTNSKAYDFKRRLEEIKQAEQIGREAKKLKKIESKAAKKQAAELVKGVYQEAPLGAIKGEGDGDGDDEMARLMGFSGGFKAGK